MEAEHYTRQSNATSPRTYLTLPVYGKTLSGLTLADIHAPSLTPATAPGLEYDFYTFTATKMANVTLILSQSLNTNSKRPLKYAITIDNHPPKIIPYIHDQANGEMPVGWEKAVSDAAWTSATTFDLAAGSHVLKFWALEPGVILQKIVVDLGGVRRSYLGPPESFRVGINVVKKVIEYGALPEMVRARAVF